MLYNIETTSGPVGVFCCTCEYQPWNWSGRVWLERASNPHGELCAAIFLQFLLGYNDSIISSKVQNE